MIRLKFLHSSFLNSFWKSLLMVLFTFVSVLTSAQVYDDSPAGYLELQPQFFEDGDFMDIYFNVKFEDRANANPVWNNGDGIYDHLEEINLSWNGTVIYGLTHTALKDLNLGASYTTSTFDLTRFANDTFRESVLTSISGDMEVSYTNTTAYSGNQDVVQARVRIKKTALAAVSGDNVARTIRMYADYYDRNTSGNVEDGAGIHYSQEFIPYTSGIDLLDVSYNTSGSFVEVSFNMQQPTSGLVNEAHLSYLWLDYSLDGGLSYEPAAYMRHGSLNTDSNPFENNYENITAHVNSYYFFYPSEDASAFSESGITTDDGANQRYTIKINSAMWSETRSEIEVKFRVNSKFLVRFDGESTEFEAFNILSDDIDLLSDGAYSFIDAGYSEPNVGTENGLVEFEFNLGKPVALPNAEAHLSYLWFDYSVDGGTSFQNIAYIRHQSLNTSVSPLGNNPESLIAGANSYYFFYEQADAPYFDQSDVVYSDGELQRFSIKLEAGDLPKLEGHSSVIFRANSGYYFSNTGSTITANYIESSEISLSEEDGSVNDEISFSAAMNTDGGYVEIDVRLLTAENETFHDWLSCMRVEANNLDDQEGVVIASLNHNDATCAVGGFSGQPIGEYFTGFTNDFVQDKVDISYSIDGDDGDWWVKVKYYFDSDDLGDNILYSVYGDYLTRDYFGNEKIVSHAYYENNDQIRGSDFISMPEVTNFTAEVTNEACSMDLSWDAYTPFADPDLNRVVIFRNGERIATFNPAEQTTFTDTDIQTNTTYAYQVASLYGRAENEDLVGDLTQAISLEIPGLEAPVGLTTAQADCDGGLTLSWIWQGATSPDAFLIQRQQTGSSFETIEANLSGSLRDYTDNNVQEGFQYTYRIAAVGGQCNVPGSYSPGRTHSRDTLDLSQTILKEALSTSKGYYGDRTELFWDLTGVNEEYINRFRIYAREMGTEVSPVLLESPGRDDRSWIHERGDAGTIYEYFVVTERVIETECGFETTSSFPIESVVGLGNLHHNLPDSGVAYAVGFRSPTAVINGSITYSGGIAVPDVKVVVEPTDVTTGKSLYFNGNTRVTVEASSYINVDTAITLSAWVKPKRLDPNVMLFKDGSYGMEFNGEEAFMFVRDTVDQTAHIVRVPSKDYKIGNWVNLTCTYSSATGALNLYVNGVKTGETVTVPEGRRIINQTNSPFLIGDYTSPGYEFLGNMDEIRIYNRALSAEDVQREYGRITSTDSDGLVAYWKVQEGDGNYIYDAAHIGSFFFKHDGEFGDGVQWSDDVPSRTQLGIAGFTHSNGSYSIEGIPYAGSGQNFQVVPTITLAGIVHEFDPQIKTLYLGEGNNVENGVDFEDISVFTVSGQVVYDFEDQVGSGTKSVGSAGVAIYLDGTTPLVDENDNPIVTNSNGEFEVSIPIGYHYLVFEKEDHTLSSGGRWPTAGFYNFVQDISGLTLYDETTHRFAGSVSGGTKNANASLFSGSQVNNIGQTYFEITSTDQVISRYVETDTTTGVFAIDLPPLSYTVSSIRWNADDLVVVPSSDIPMLNMGAESAYDGLFETDSVQVPVLNQVYPTLEARQAISNFQIDQMDATTLSYSWSLERDDLVSVSHQWISNTDTITYFIDSDGSGYAAGSYTYQVDYAGAGAIDGDGVMPKALLLVYESADEVLEVGVEITNVTSRPLAKYDTLGYEYEPDTTFYHVRSDYSYRVAPTLEVTTVGDTIFGGESLYSYNGGEEITAIDLLQLPYPSFFSNEFYSLEISAAEVYTNKDNEREYQIPVTDGVVTVNSSIGISYILDDEGNREFGQGNQLSLNEDGIAVYLFTAGDPSTTQITSSGEEQNSFTKTINVSLETNDYNVTWPADPVNDPQRAYVMGKVKIPGASFITEAPEVVEMILRDPPGSDSYAYRTSGTGYTMTEEFVASGFGSLSGSAGGGIGVGFALGGSFVAHGELSGDVEATVSLGVRNELESSAGSTVERSVEFVETISTNAEPIEVGSSDLFVAKSQNLEAGYAYKVLPLPLSICGENCFGDTITLGDGSQYQMGLVADSYVSADGLPTYALYSENHIVTVLIPDLVGLRNSVLLNSPSYTSHLSQDHPYFGTNNDDPVWGPDATSDNAIRTEPEDLSGQSYTFDNGGNNKLEDSIRYFNQQIRLWKDVLALNEIEKWAALQSAGIENVSLASGVTLERESTNTATSVSTLSFELVRAAELNIDANLNAVVAFRSEIDAEVGLKANSTSTRGEESANTTGYVLLDSDENDVYSINVAPGVGSSGPVFSTIGGQTSCPFEPADVMEYATPQYIDRAIADKMKAVAELEKTKNLTDIIVAQVEEQIQKAQDDISKAEKDVRDYANTIEGLIQKAADAEGIQEEVQNILLGVVEGVPGLLQTAVEPVVSGVNSFISSVKEFSIPIPFAGKVTPFESIPEIPIPENQTGDLSIDMAVVQEIVEKRMREVASVAKDAIDSGNELIVRLQKRIKERLFDVNKLTEKKLELELDIDRINAEIDALNNQITLFEQLKTTLQNSSEPIFLSNATLQREKPTLLVNGAETAQVYNVPAEEKANFTLLLGNESESGDAMYYNIQTIGNTNPNGLVLSIDGLNIATPREFLVEGGGAIQKVLTVERGPFEYDYEGIKVLISSTCQYDPTSNTALIADTVTLDVKFIPTCSDVAIISPANNWVGNHSSAGRLPVHIGDYDINSTGLEYIQLEYKASSSSDWLQMARYYRDENIEGWETGNPTLPQTGNEFIHQWDFSSLGLPDGNYDIRTVAHCTLADTESDIHSGLIDTVLPHVFGSPQPADGVFSADDEISIQFNEPINEGLVKPSNVQIKGVLNGAEVRHNASVYFNGTTDQYMEIAQGINLTRKSFSVDLYVKRDGTDAAVLLAQGGAADRSMVIGFDATDHPYLSMDGNVLTATNTITDQNWHHLAFVYDHANADALIYDNGIMIGVDNSFAQDYQSSGRIFVGKSTFGDELPFTGNIHELRIWNKAHSATDVNIAATRQMSANQRGLIGNWRMEEAKGDVAKDLVRSKHAMVYAEWMIEPGGLAYTFDGVNHLEASSPAFTAEDNFTIEFWVNGAAVTDSVTFLSNGRGDTEDANVSGWSIGTDASGLVIVKNNDQVIETGISILDESWHHLALAVNRVSKTTIYLDGEEEGSIASADLAGFGGSKLWIGARGWYDGTIEEIDQQFTGVMDEIRIWKLAKREEHINNEIQNKLNGDEAGLVQYYPFESYEDVGGGVLAVNQESDNQATTALAAANILSGTVSGQFTENTAAIKLPQPIENVSFNYSSNGDQIILSPTTDADRIENVVLTISVQNIQDLNGNRMASPATWTAYVDRSTLNWVESEKSFDVPLGEGVTFTAEIFNEGGNIETFSLTNIPSWLSANPTSGSVQPLTTQEIEFTVSDGTNIGTYVQDIVMENSFGFDERLILNLNVFQNPPEDWSADPEDYEYSMSILSRVRIKGEFSRDENDLVAAFIGGECRGVGSLQYIASQDNYQAYLSVYSNDLTGESVDYRIWNASEGLVHTFVTNSNSGVETFTADGFFGTVLDPVIFDAGVNIERVQEIKSGWQWLSFNLTSSDFSSVNTFMSEFPSANGDQVKSQQYYDQYDSINGWVGTISTVARGIQSGEMYKFRLANAGKLKYRGEPVDPAVNAVTLNEGWNWVSFLGQNLIPINEALANVSGLNVGDVIKSQRQFATYGGAGVGWIGSLAVMEPGQGYMYKAATAGNIVYPKAAATSRVLAPDYGYMMEEGLDETRFPDNMTMIAETNFEYDYLLAYAGEELRGIAVPVFNPETNSQVYFMTVFGDGEAELRFTGVKDEREDELTSEQLYSFAAQSGLGTLAEPVMLKGSILNTPIASDLNIYPNPVKSKVAVSFEAGKYQKVVLVSVAGQEIASWNLDVFDANITLDLSEMASGVYVLKLEGEETISRKLIKE